MVRKRGTLIREERVVLSKNLQKQLIELTKSESGLTWNKLSEYLDVSETTIKHTWKFGLSTIPKSKFYKLLEIVPKDSRDKFVRGGKILPVNWGQSKGGKSCIDKIRKTNIPIIGVGIRENPKFSELVGIILGDGHISEKSVIVTLEYPAEAEYAIYTSNLFKELFGLESKIRINKKGTAVIVNTNSKYLVRFLVESGLKIGNKIRNNVGIPSYIMDDMNLIRSVVRGLIDTDGGYYRKEKKGDRIIMEFKSETYKLRCDFIKCLKKSGFKVSKSGSPIGVRVQSQEDVERLFSEVGTKNPKTIFKMSEFAKTRYMPLTKSIIDKIQTHQ